MYKRQVWYFGLYKNTDFQNILSNQEIGRTSNESVTDDDIEEKFQSSIGTLSDDNTILIKNNIIVINYSIDNPGEMCIRDRLWLLLIRFVTVSAVQKIAL